MLGVYVADDKYNWLGWTPIMLLALDVALLGSRVNVNGLPLKAPSERISSA